MNTRYIKTLVVVINCLLVMSGCSPKVIPPTEVRDSTRVIIREHLVHDSVFVQIPIEVEKIVTKSDSSHLENSYSKSDAWIDNDGDLHHTLESKPQKVKVPVDIPVTDTTTYKEHHEVPHTEYIEVEKKLTWWQQTQMIGFKFMLFLILASLAIKYRGGILKLVKMLK